MRQITGNNIRATGQTQPVVMTPTQFLTTLIGRRIVVDGFTFVAVGSRSNQLVLRLCESELEIRRMQLGLTQADVAGRLGITQGTFQKIESGTTKDAHWRDKIHKLYDQLSS